MELEAVHQHGDLMPWDLRLSNCLALQSTQRKRKEPKNPFLAACASITSHRPAVYSGRDRGRVLNMPQEGVVERILEQMVDMSGPQAPGEDHP